MNKIIFSTIFSLAVLAVYQPGIAAAADAADASKDAAGYVIVLENDAFSPAELTIPANQKVSITIKNMGKTAAEFESHSLHREKVIGPGKEASINLGPLEPGTYDFFNEFHEETKGQIVVK